MLPTVGRLIPAPWRPATPASTGSLPGPAPAQQSPLQLLLVDRRDPAVVRAMDSLFLLLAPEEQQRWRALRRIDDRERFVLGRAVLRIELGLRLRCPPRSLILRSGSHGKPYLAWPGGDTRAGVPRFNVAHSGDLVLLGFHATREVGVDVEQLRPQLEWQRIARRCLPEEQFLRLEGLPAGRQLPAFLEAWCRLEAVLKARGVGLFGLDQAPTDGVHPTEPAEELWSIALPAGYCGAAALA